MRSGVNRAEPSEVHYCALHLFLDKNDTCSRGIRCGIKHTLGELGSHYVKTVELEMLRKH